MSNKLAPRMYIVSIGVAINVYDIREVLWDASTLTVHYNDGTHRVLHSSEVGGMTIDSTARALIKSINQG